MASARVFICGQRAAKDVNNWTRLMHSTQNIYDDADYIYMLRFIWSLQIHELNEIAIYEDNWILFLINETVEFEDQDTGMISRLKATDMSRMQYYYIAKRCPICPIFVQNKYSTHQK